MTSDKAADQHMIEVTGISKYFGPIKALQDVSFVAEKGEILGLLGLNGAGKTTMMRILSCFLPPTRGTAKVAGFDVTDNPLAVRRKIGCFLENSPAYPTMRVDCFLDFVAEVKGIGKSKRKKYVAEVVEICALGQVGRQIIGNLSKGYRKRVGLAQSILGDSDVLILDEPTAGLDPEQVVEVRNLIKRLAGEKTILLSSHVLSEVSIIADRVIIINKGEVLAAGSPKALSDDLQQTFRVLADIKGPLETIEAGLKKISGVLRVDREKSVSEVGPAFIIEGQKTLDLEKEITGLVFENGWDLRRLQSIKFSLEEVFLKLVKQETDE